MCATWLIERFEEPRPRLRAVAYRARFGRRRRGRRSGGVAAAEPEPGHVDNVDAWLTTVVARICLNTLRARRARHEQDLLERLPDPIIDPPGDFDPEHQALLADSVGLALFVVLDTVPPAERLAFVLHDVFAVPFDEIASIVDRSPEAARKLASRAVGAFSRHDRSPTATSPLSARSSMRFSPPDEPATSSVWSRCLTRMWCCAPTSADPRCR